MLDIGTKFVLVAITLLSYVVFRIFQQRILLRKLTNRAVRGDTGERADREKASTLSECSWSPRSQTLPIVSRRSSARFSEEIESRVEAHRSNPVELVRTITDLCSRNYDAASASYFQGKEAGILTSATVTSEMFLSLCSSCIRVGSPHFLFKYFNEMDDFEVGRDLDFFNSIVKILTFKRHYKVNLSLNDLYLNLVVARGIEDERSARLFRSIYSCMLYSAVETKEYWRAHKFYKHIERSGCPPSERDFLNISKATVAREDFKSLPRLIEHTPLEMSKRGLNVMISDLLAASRQEVITQIIGDFTTPIETVNELLSILKRRAPGVPVVEAVATRSDVTETSFDQLFPLIQAQALDDLTIINLVNKFSAVTVPRAIMVINHLLKRLGDQSLVISQIVPLLKQNVINACFGPTVVPDGYTYGILFKATQTFTHVMEVYRISEAQSTQSNFVPDQQFFINCLLAIAGKPITSSSWIVTKSILENMEGKYGTRINGFCLSAVINILTSSANLKVSSPEVYLEEFASLLASHSARLKLHVQAIEFAVTLKNIKWINELFQLMVKVHGGSVRKTSPPRLTRSVSSDVLGTETVDQLLSAALRADPSLISFCLLLELVLLNKLPLSERTISGRVRTNKRVTSILAKYKYRL